MRRPWLPLLALAAALAAPPAPASAPDAGVRRASKRPATQPAPEPVVAVDACAEFNRSQRQGLSPEAHEQQFGCPPCPCACVNGQVTCAPCAACEGFGGPRDKQVARPGPRPDAGL